MTLERALNGQVPGGLTGMIRMNGAEFERLSAFIEESLGIKMPPVKRTLLESRLQKRLKALGMGSFTEYCDYLFSTDGTLSGELVHMIDLVTTNKTDFFREPDHFYHLSGAVLPEILGRDGAGFRRPLKAWSAGCSTGEEPYTLAMVMSEFGRTAGLAYEYSITATDVSTRVLEAARRGTYPEERVAPIPMELRRRYLLRSRDRSKGLVRIAPELRCRVCFMRLNFMDDDFGFAEPFDVIFCRNVVIYFERETQRRLFEKFCGLLNPGGYLFIGHSETLNGLDLPLEKAAASVYRRIQARRG